MQVSDGHFPLLSGHTYLQKWIANQALEGSRGSTGPPSSPQREWLQGAEPWHIPTHTAAAVPHCQTHCQNQIRRFKQLLTSQPQVPTRAWEAASGTAPRDVFPENLEDVLTQEPRSLVAENKPQGTPVPYPPGENGLIASSRHLKSTSLF